MNVTIDQAVCTFGDVRAVAGVSLDIADGELFFLLGASGCGKTTLLRAIAGFQDLASGRILFDGRDVTGVPPHRRNTGMMFQGYALWPHLTVAENVAFGLEQRGIAKAERQARVAKALDRVRIADLAARKPNQLSGGQQQRVALARTLVVEPGVLLLDEPLANLDAKLRLEMRNEIRRLCKETGLTAVYVTHDQKEALSVADRLAVMNRGVLQQVGSPREVFTRPSSRFVAEFIGETNLIPGRVTERRNDGTAAVTTPCGTLRAAVCPVDAVAGKEVTLSVRPEALALHPAAPDAAAPADAIAGTVADVTYLGGLAQYAVRPAAAPDTLLHVTVLNPRVPLAPGAAVLLSAAPDDVAVLTA